MEFVAFWWESIIIVEHWRQAPTKIVTVLMGSGPFQLQVCPGVKFDKEHR